MSRLTIARLIAAGYFVTLAAVGTLILYFIEG